MRTTRLIAWAAGAILLSRSTAFPAETAETAGTGKPPRDWWGTHYEKPREQLFSREFFVEGFGSYMAAQTKFSHVFQTDISGGTWGGGVGFGYFVTRIIGAEAEVNMPDNGGHLVDSVAASVIARLPIESVGLAPYVFGGGGRTTDQIWEWTRHVGFGLEYRLDPKAGVFVDARYVWGERTSDNTLFRAGLRFAF